MQSVQIGGIRHGLRPRFAASIESVTEADRILGSYIYTSIGAAKRNAATEREKSWSMIMEQRRSLGMDVEDMVADRMRRKDLRAQAAGATPGEADR